MSLTSQIPNLNDLQLRSLHDTMLNASLAHENGGNPREIFRRAKYKNVGLLRRIYELLQHATWEEIDNMSACLAEVMKPTLKRNGKQVAIESVIRARVEGL